MPRNSKYIVTKGYGFNKAVAVFDTKALAAAAIRGAGFRYNKDQYLFTKKDGNMVLVVWIDEVAYNELDLGDETRQ